MHSHFQPLHVSEARRIEAQTTRQRWKKSLMRPSCAASLSFFAHSTSSRPISFFIWPNITFNSFFFTLSGSLSLFSPPRPACLFFSRRFPFPRTPGSTYKSHLAQSIQKNCNSFSGDRTNSIRSLPAAKRSLLEHKASQFQSSRENPSDCFGESFCCRNFVCNSGKRELSSSHCYSWG